MISSKVTRGYGVLENFLAKQRTGIANKLIPVGYRNGRILDIGCGLYPYFLMNVNFNEKFGIDKVVKESDHGLYENRLIVINHDVEIDDILPFCNEYFDVVTMLAVLEHIEPMNVLKILKEVKRVLKNDGIYILTTPSFWTDWLLRFMSKIRLVSPVEIQEHKAVYDHSKIHSLLQEASFSEKRLRFGYFELFMNIWVTAKK